MTFFPLSDEPARTPAEPSTTTPTPTPAPRPSRLTTACQQLLVLGVIVAVLTPAARVVSIDFAPAPEGGEAGSATGAGASGGLAPMSMAAYTAAATTPSLVPTAVVDPVVREVRLTSAGDARLARGAISDARTVSGGGEEILSAPQPVTGYGAIGLTWGHGETVADDAISIEARLFDDGAWSGWTALEYHDDHGPDPDSEEGRKARPGTDELLVGDVDQVQVRVVTDEPAPADLKLAVIDPGVATSSAEELPAIDTGALAGEPATPPSGSTGSTGSTEQDGDGTLSSSAGDLQLSKAAYTPRPVIYSRAQWGADESLRDKSSLHYFEVHAGFVHHTVSANGYKADDVPAILRGIYAYHTKSRGWSDVGYNYLVDRFGRIWEGRAGGVDRPVVGAHTLGYNDDSFAASAIGNFEETRPSQAMVQAYGALFGWKLSLHGVNAASTRQYVTKDYFKAINGHRDAGSTACPGKYLYAKIPEIRTLARQAQRPFSGRQLESDVTDTDPPDLVVRRASDGQGFVVPMRRVDGKVRRGTPVAMGLDLSQQDRIFNAGDWDRDGDSDLITRLKSSGNLYFRPGRGDGTYGAPVRLGSFKNINLLAAVGDMTGDGWPDLMGQPTNGDMRIYPGRGASGIRPSYVAYSGIKGSQQIPVGLWDGDGAPDAIVRNNGKLVLYPGNGPGGWTGAKSLTLDPAPYDKIVGISDMDLTGHPDLLARRKDTGQLVFIAASATTFAAPKVIGPGYGGFDLFG